MSNAAAPTYQELILRLQNFWAERGCVLQQPYDIEVGAGTMAPETFLRVLGPKPYKVAYVQPSRRPADGRYGDNPNRLYKHMQLQVILKPPPENVQELYLESLKAALALTCASTTSSLKKTTGKRQRWRHGASGGR